MVYSPVPASSTGIPHGRNISSPRPIATYSAVKITWYATAIKPVRTAAASGTAPVIEYTS
jgi:hypothetical protein